MHYRLVCLIFSIMSADRIGLGITHEVFIFTHHMFMHSSCIHSFPSFLFWTCVVLCCVVLCSFFFISLSRIEPIYDTQTEKIHFGSEPSSRFRVIFFCFSYCSLSHPVLWWEGQDGSLWELPRMWLLTPHFVTRIEPHLEGKNGNFALEIYILILVIRSLISFHKNDLDVVTIKSINYKP